MPKTATLRAHTEAFEPEIADATEGAVLDRRALDAIREMESPNMPDVLEQIVEVYLEHAPKQLDILAEAVETADVRTQNRIAHTLKSSSANLGARDLAALCQTLETATHHGPCAQAAELTAEITGSFVKVREALLVELARG